jgi:hypothetical protein
MPLGALPANTGKKMSFTGTSILKVENGLIVEEVGLDRSTKPIEDAEPTEGCELCWVLPRVAIVLGRADPMSASVYPGTRCHDCVYVDATTTR